MTIETFCTQHDAGDEFRKWALETCTSMQDVWDKAPDEWLVWIAQQPGVLFMDEYVQYRDWAYELDQGWANVQNCTYTALLSSRAPAATYTARCDVVREMQKAEKLLTPFIHAMWLRNRTHPNFK